LSVIPPPSRRALRHFARNVDVPKSRSQRLFKRLRSRSAPVSATDPLAKLMVSVLGESEIGAVPADRLRSVMLIDEDADGRRRALAFLFHGDAEAPFAVGKAQTDACNGSLIRESDSLMAVRPMLSPELRATVPEVLTVHASERGEALVVTALPGRSAYFEMQGMLMPWRFVERHFAAAERWLAAFHVATRRDESTVGRHGDYWAHNVLTDDHANVGVVDWEHFASADSRYIDLFHYPLTYGMSYPWRFYERADPEEAFGRTFLHRNRVSRGVRTYLHGYASRTGVARRDLAGAFRQFLATRGTMSVDAPPHPGVRDLPWTRFAALFDGAAESVFS
jgi:aminoglycoside phosphotransferase